MKKEFIANIYGQPVYVELGEVLDKDATLFLIRKYFQEANDAYLLGRTSAPLVEEKVLDLE